MREESKQLLERANETVKVAESLEDREMADYNVSWNASADEAKKRLKMARKFVEEIQQLFS